MHFQSLQHSLEQNEKKKCAEDETLHPWREPLQNVDIYVYVRLWSLRFIRYLLAMFVVQNKFM